MSLEQQINRAISLEKKGEILKAKDIYRSILKVFPKNVRVQRRLEALNILKQINNLHPPQKDIDKLIKLFNQKHFSSVIEHSQALIREYPNAFFIWDLMGATNQLLGKPDEALKDFKQAIQLNSNYENAYYNMGVVLLEDYNNPIEAIEAFKKSISLNPKNARAYNNMGNSLRKLGRFEEAINVLNKAILIESKNAIFYRNAGNVLAKLGNLNEAIETYNKALLLKPDYPETYYDLSFSYNLKGDLQKGLQLYEWRLKKDGFPTRIPKDHLNWDGKNSVLDKKFFVYEEQGLGDTIQFVRYLPLLKQKGAKVIFKVKPKMHALLKTVDENIVFVDRDPDDNSIDFEAPLMSLPYLFKTNLKSIPFKTSYLSADHNKIISWKKHLPKDNFKVGICWQGSKNKIDFGRSFPLTLFEDISKLPNLKLISLHKGEGEKQIENINFDLTVLGNDFDNGEDAFIDTAAVMANCDLIITCDTAIAHLAGALGYRTWVLLKKIPDWRWLLDRNDSPWYPNMRLYRQKERDKWETVFETIKKDLKSLITLREN